MIDDIPFSPLSLVPYDPAANTLLWVSAIFQDFDASWETRRGVFRFAATTV